MFVNLEEIEGADIFRPDTLVRLSPPVTKIARMSPHIAPVVELLNEINAGDKARSPYHGFHAIAASERAIEAIRALSWEETRQIAHVLRQLLTEVHNLNQWNKSRMLANQSRAIMEGKPGYSTDFIAKVEARFQELQEALTRAVAKPRDQKPYENILIFGLPIIAVTLGLGLIFLLNPACANNMSYNTAVATGWIFIVVSIASCLVTWRLVITALRKKTTVATTQHSEDKTSWVYKCEHLGVVIASNEHGAFALNSAKRQLWLATPETAFKIKTDKFAGDHAYAIGVLHTTWDAMCKGPYPITEDSFKEIMRVFG